MATSEQLEREAEATRARIAATLDELRGRMTAGQLVDQLVDYARDSGGGEFVRNFGNQVVGNPIPVTLVGAGLAWLMMAGRQGPSLGGGVMSGFGFGTDDVAKRMSESGQAHRGSGTSDHLGGGLGEDDVAEGMSESGRARRTPAQSGNGFGETARSMAEQTSANAAGLSDHAVRRAQEWTRRTRATAGRFNEQLGEAGSSLQDAAASASANMRDAASSAYGAASGTYNAATERAQRGADAIGRGARTMGDNLAATGQGVLGFLQEQPLVLAGIGLALGAVLGGALPPTETEDQLVGEASTAVKHDAKAFADQQVDRGMGMAEQAWDAVKPEINEELHARPEQSGDSGAEHEPGGEATLVPSDKVAQADETPAGGGTRHDTERSS